jgi:hypothetical protein
MDRRRASDNLQLLTSARHPLGEQVAHRTRLAAEQVAEERVGGRESSLPGGEEESEQESRHGLRAAVRDLPGHPLLVV